MASLKAWYWITCWNFWEPKYNPDIFGSHNQQSEFRPKNLTKRVSWWQFQESQSQWIWAPRFSEGRPSGRVWQWVGRGELEGWLYFEHVNTHLIGSQVRNKDKDKKKTKIFRRLQYCAGYCHRVAIALNYNGEKFTYSQPARQMQKLNTSKH